MLNNVTYLNCRSCGRLLQKSKFKSGYCPSCLRGRIAGAMSLSEEALRMVELSNREGSSTAFQIESITFCKLATDKIRQAEADIGQSLVDAEDLAQIDAFIHRNEGLC